MTSDQSRFERSYDLERLSRSTLTSTRLGFPEGTQPVDLYVSDPLNVVTPPRLSLHSQW